MLDASVYCYKNPGNMLFGMHICASRFCSAVAFALVAALAVYMKLAVIPASGGK